MKHSIDIQIELLIAIQFLCLIIIFIGTIGEKDIFSMNMGIGLLTVFLMIFAHYKGRIR